MELEATVSLEKLITEVSKHIGLDWKFLARALGFTQTDIDAIESDNVLHLKEQIYQLFYKWRQQEGIDATSKRLLDAISGADHLNSLLITLLEEQCVSRKPSSSSAVLASSLAAGARASSSQQKSVVSSAKREEKQSPPAPLRSVTSPEQELMRRKRLERFSSTPSDSSNSPSLAAVTEKDSTAKASSINQPPDDSKVFEVGDCIKVCGRYGVIKWLGEVPGVIKCAAGLEMEEVIEGGHSGAFNGNTYFNCESGHGLLLPQHSLERDDRFGEVVTPPQSQPTHTPVNQLDNGGSPSASAPSNTLSSSAERESTNSSSGAMANSPESVLRRLLSDPSFSEAFNEITGSSPPTRQHHDSSTEDGAKQLVFFIPKDRAGLVVGREGKNIQEVERETNTSINVESSRLSAAGNAKGVIIGSEENCKRALVLIMTNLDRRISQRLATTEKVTIPNRQMVGRVIGKRGCNREAIERLSGAKLEINPIEGIDAFLSEEHHCKITGSAKQIEEAKKLIDRAMLGEDIAGNATMAALIVKLASHLGFVIEDDM